jgi:hypothetical protein
MSSYSNSQVQELNRRATQAEAERDAVCAAHEQLLTQIAPFVQLASELAQELSRCPVCAMDQPHEGQCRPHLQRAEALGRLAASIHACMIAPSDHLCL